MKKVTQKKAASAAPRKPAKKTAEAVAAIQPKELTPSVPTVTPARHWAVLALTGVFCLAGAVWAWGNLYAVRLQIGSQQISARLRDDVLQQTIADQATTYRLLVRYPDNTLMRFPLQTAGVRPDPAATVADLRRAQHSWQQRILWWRPIPMRLQARLDRANLNNFVNTQARLVTAAPRNATLTLDDTTIQLDPGASGKAYTLPNPTETVTEAAAQLQTDPLKLVPMTIPPQLTAAKLATTKHKLEAILSQKITIRIGDEQVSPKAADIASWITLQPANEAPPTIAVDASRISDYVDSLAGGYVSTPRSQLLDTSGAIVRPGRHGARVLSTQSASDAIAGLVLNGKGADVSLAVQLTDFSTVTSPTNGKWLEVDLTNKRMYAYNQNAEVRSFLVSAGAAATPTVTGRYAIYSKYVSEDMFGENVDGSHYFQPSVPWVNYFYGDYAIHGNYWRPSYYFGNVNSSHGCVGVSVSDGAWIYKWAPLGTPVVVHR